MLRKIELRKFAACRLIASIDKMATVETLARTMQAALAAIHAQTSSNDDRSRAQVSLDSLVADAQWTPLVLPACFQLLQGGGDAAACHFALSTISKYIKDRSDILSESEWTGLKGGLLSLFQGSGKLPFFVISKLVDVVCDVAVRTWPNDWPDLLQLTLSINTGWAICLFARICDCLSEDSLSVRCIAPQRQIALRIGLAEISDTLARTCVEYVQTSSGSSMPQLQWVIELVNGLAIATKQSSHLIKHGLHQLILNAFVSCPEPALKMLCVECLSNFIHFLNGQSGRTYTIARATREEDLSLLNGIIKVTHHLIEPDMIRKYCEEDESRDSVKAFVDLLTDIRKTSNIFCYFPNLDGFTNVLLEIASVHPSLCVQINAMTNIDALVRMKSIVADRRVFLLCFLACHDFYTPSDTDKAPVPSLSMFPHIGNAHEVKRRRSLCTEEAEEEDMRPNELFGKLKNAALLSVRHITMSPSTGASFIDFIKEILSESINPGVGVGRAYFPSLLFCEAVASALPANDPKLPDISAIVDIVASNCFPGHEQDYLWFIGKAGSLITEAHLHAVFSTILKFGIAANFPVQVAFISLCKSNVNSFKLANDLHQALQVALAGESRSWAIGAILTASAHGGIGAADGYATTVYTEMKAKLETIAAAAATSPIEEFAKATNPIFLTFKAIIEVPLSSSVSAHISTELASSLLPFCWSRLFRDSSEFGVGPNEFLSVVGSQFVQEVASGPPQQFNACFQVYLLITQVAGLCLPFIPPSNTQAIQSIESMFNPGWNLRPSLLNILMSNVGAPAGHTRPAIALRALLPRALTTLQRAIDLHATDEFTVGAISRASLMAVQIILNSLQIATDDEFSVSEFTGAAKPTLTQKQLRAQVRSRNRFAMIAEDAPSATTAATLGPKIPYELLSDPAVALELVGKCIGFRTDKALRRICQSVPTIITRWWNTSSNNATFATKFVEALPGMLLKPIIQTLYCVRMRDPATLTGGELYSYTCDRAVSGRKLASELVDHSTISIQGILSVLWRFSTAGTPVQSVDAITVMAGSEPFRNAVGLLLEARQIPASTEAVTELVNHSRDTSMESRASLKYIVHSIAVDGNSARTSGNVGGGTRSGSDVVRATNSDVSNSTQREIAVTNEEQLPGTLFH